MISHDKVEQLILKLMATQLKIKEEIIENCNRINSNILSLNFLDNQINYLIINYIIDSNSRVKSNHSEEGRNYLYIELYSKVNSLFKLKSNMIFLNKDYITSRRLKAD